MNSTCLLGFGQSLLLFLVPLLIAAQPSGWKAACGECTVTETRTLAEAKSCAFNQSIEAAFIAAGVPRSVKSTSTLQFTEATQLFFEAIQVEWQGGIRGERNGEYSKTIDDLGDIVVTHCAEFDVIEYKTKSQPNFRFATNGLNSVYMNNDPIEFTVDGPAGCLQAFLIEGDRAYRFFPNDSEKEGCLERFNNTAFPSAESQRKYELYREPGEEGPWLLTFVFTREDMVASVPDEWSALELLFWMQSIEPENRFTQLHPFTFVD